MHTARIPWQIFFDSLADQSRSKLEAWLLGWRFSNEGVYVADRKSRFRRELRAGDGAIHFSKKITSSKSKGRL
jgi:hypothetical protein